MSLDIWKECNGSLHITSLSDTAWRMVESQEGTSTRKLVNSISEQILLEEMIEEIKPSIPTDFSGLHPLLYTPFRYPPLLYGSRFGKSHERAIWYGSKELKTAMAETAFYRLNFLNASEAAFGVITMNFTAFSVDIQAEQAIKLIDPPFSQFTNIIASPVDYSDSQKLGAAMREAGVDAFNYQSARDETGVNIALFTPTALASKKPKATSFQSWQCVTDHRSVEFVRTSAIEASAFIFSSDMFLINGKLPFPAI